MGNLNYSNLIFTLDGFFHTAVFYPAPSFPGRFPFVVGKQTRDPTPFDKVTEKSKIQIRLHSSFN